MPLKKFLTILLFMSFAARPIYYTGYVAYFQFNIDYIIDTYCVNKNKPQLACNGKCHLAKQLNVNTNQEKEAAIINLVESFIPVYCEEYPTVVFNALEEEQPNHINVIYFGNYSYLFSNNNFKPPAV